MTKQFFTRASPKAAKGIIRAYEARNARVSAEMNPRTGEFTVVAIIPDNGRPARSTVKTKVLERA